MAELSRLRVPRPDRKSKIKDAPLAGSIFKEIPELRNCSGASTNQTEERKVVRNI